MAIFNWTRSPFIFLPSSKTWSRRCCGSQYTNVKLMSLIFQSLLFLPATEFSGLWWMFGRKSMIWMIGIYSSLGIKKYSNVLLVSERFCLNLYKIHYSSHPYLARLRYIKVPPLKTTFPRTHPEYLIEQKQNKSLLFAKNMLR